MQFLEYLIKKKENLQINKTVSGRSIFESTHYSVFVCRCKEKLEKNSLPAIKAKNSLRE
jgi:hypothetical protein